jgi:lipoate-protein ligase B
MPEAPGEAAVPPVQERRFRTLRPGRLPYGAALALQEDLLDKRRQRGEDTLILLEHPPVITFGRRVADSHLLLSDGELARRGIELARTGRGGDITYHGPGQLVGYPIVDLDPLGRDLHRYLRLLEAMLIDALAAFAVTGETVSGKTGVWVEGAKVASIGVGVRRWVSWHGFALNVGSDLSGFDAIVPCGLQGVAMTSLERLLGRPVPLPEVEERVIDAFAKVFACRHAGECEI